MAALHGINVLELICDAAFESYYAARTWTAGSSSRVEAICLPTSSWWPPCCAQQGLAGGFGLAVPVGEGLQDLRRGRHPGYKRAPHRACDDSLQETMAGSKPSQSLSALTGCRTQAQQNNPAHEPNPHRELCNEYACYRRA
jgi:hypothetical protein